MAIKIPRRATMSSLAGFASDIVTQCTVSQRKRVDRGAFYNNLFLTGAVDGATATYNKTNIHVANLSAFMFSPVELRYSIVPTDTSQAEWRAQAAGAAALLHRLFRTADVDSQIDMTVLQSAIRGKAFLQLLWTDRGFESYTLQPELMGVLREDLSTLDQQEAFTFATYMTEGQFAALVSNHPDRDEILRKAKKFSAPADPSTSPQNLNMLKTVVMGGGWGSSPVKGPDDGANSSRGMVDWLTSPAPEFDPELMASLIKLDETWVRDADTNDWTTLQTVGDSIVVEGRYLRRNLFADPATITDQELLKRSKEHNPLAGHQPFLEFCPNPVHGYFWGRSEVFNVSLLQLALNRRIDGINALLRRQEDPPYKFTGGRQINQTVLAKLKKPGGFYSDADPNAKVDNLAPDLPDDLWLDVHEIERRFDEMGGFTPTMQGRGDAGVRGRAQAETLIRTAGPRFKARALRIERSVERVGALGVDILKARYPYKVSAWAKPNADEDGAAPMAWWRNLWTAPAPGMKRIEFLMASLPPDWSVRVDSHSSSPAFSYEAKELAFALAKAGAIGAPDLITMTHPPHEEALALQAESKAIAQEAMIAANPMLMLEMQKKKK